mmetsp:Transcript_32828/g.85937  ORF Transcript_32828/g.85937 Transcript_32828/m.85937 type:complete len:264 (+) Transcript_32828:101-892(+)
MWNLQHCCSTGAAAAFTAADQQAKRGRCTAGRSSQGARRIQPRCTRSTRPRQSASARRHRMPQRVHWTETGSPRGAHYHAARISRSCPTPCRSSRRPPPWTFRHQECPASSEGKGPARRVASLVQPEDVGQGEAATLRSYRRASAATLLCADGPNATRGPTKLHSRKESALALPSGSLALRVPRRPRGCYAAKHSQCRPWLSASSGLPFGGSSMRARQEHMPHRLGRRRRSDPPRLAPGSLRLPCTMHGADVAMDRSPTCPCD